MKKIIILILAASAAGFSGTLYKLHVPADGGYDLPRALAGRDIVDIKPGAWADVIVSEAELAELDARGIGYEIVITDVESYWASQVAGEGPFGNYYTHAEALAILDSLHTSYPGIISDTFILPNDDSNDTTWDGNTVWAIKISDNVEADEDEPELLYTGVHHAREPIGCNITVEFARWLCQSYGSDPEATYLVEEREIWIIPVLNPDGYLYNEEVLPGGGGNCSKNRRPTPDAEEYWEVGVDLNRNYPYMWGYDDAGSGPEPTDYTYRGPYAGSEPETQSIMNLCSQREFVTCLNFHSHGQWFLYPYGYEDVECEDGEQYFAWGEIGTRTCHYTVVPGYGLYNTNGDSDDWMYGETVEKNRIFAVTPEVGTDFWQDWLVDEHVEETKPLMITTAKAASAYPELLAVDWQAGSDGNIDVGETVDVVVWVHNMSVKDPSGEIELVLTTTEQDVELVKSTAVIGSLDPMSTGNNQADPLKVRMNRDSAAVLTLAVSSSSDEVVYQVIMPVGERHILIDEDFEDFDEAGWYNGFAVTDEDAHSGTHSLTDSPGIDYAPEKYYNFEMKNTIDLSEMVTAEFSFWNLYHMESGWDWGYVEVQTENTGGWVTLKRFSRVQEAWAQERFDLTGYCGSEEFKLRFTLITDQLINLDGWHIDDLLLTAFEGEAQGTGVHQLVDVRPVIRPVESLTTGNVSFVSHPGTEVDVRAYDASGREVASTRGITPFTWRMRDAVGRDLAAGPYFVKTSYPDGETNRKVVVVE